MKIKNVAKVILIISLLKIVLIGCNYNSASKMYIEPKDYNDIIMQCPSLKASNIIVYYFNGDCSICVGKILQVEHDLKKSMNAEALYIAKTSDPSFLTYSLKRNHITSCVIIENKKDTSMQKYFKLDEFYIIDKNREVSSIYIKGKK